MGRSGGLVPYGHKKAPIRGQVDRETTGVKIKWSQ